MPDTCIDVIPLEYFLATTADDQRFTVNQYVQVTGYLRYAGYGGPETCNCHSKEAVNQDFHLEITLKPGETARTEAMICELTRFTRTLTLAEVKQFIGQRVTVTGWLFWDGHHVGNAKASRPDSKFIWRYTCWEIHPVFKLELAQ